MRKRKIMICLFLILYSSIWAQISSKQIDDLVERALIKYDVVGAAVGIVKDGKIIHAKGYGYTSYNTKEKVDEHTSFAIASNSKAFTSAALAILIDQGILDWYDKVTNYIPDFKMYNPYVTENFMIIDLLTHRSGLGPGAGDLMSFPDGGDFTIEDVLKCFQYFKPYAPFRSQFEYNNLLYMVAGEIVARVSGMGYDEFIETHIFKPLSMSGSFGAFATKGQSKNQAKPHIVDNETGIREIEPFFENINSAAGGIQSSAYDMCQWMLVHLNQGNYGTDLKKTLFSDSSQKEMWKVHTIMDVKTNAHYNNHFMGYGLGWFLSDISGKLSVLHTGSVPGMLSKTWIIPELDLGVVILTNTSDSGGSLYAAVSKTITDAFLGLENVDWLDHHYNIMLSRNQKDDLVTQQVWNQVSKNKNLKLNFEDYLGVYKDPWFGKILIYEEGNKLWFKSYRSPKLKGGLFFYKGNTFVVKWDDRSLYADAFVNFQLDEEGKAYQIKMKGVSPGIDFSYDFQDLNLKKISQK